MKKSLAILVAMALIRPSWAWGQNAEDTDTPDVGEDGTDAVEAETAGEEEAATEEAATEEARTLVAVLFLATGPVDPTLADNLTEVLVAAVASAGQFTIVGREQFGEALGFGGEGETLECAEDPVCLGRIATLVGAEEVVLGFLGERAGRYLVNLTRIDVRRAEAVHRVFRATLHDVGPLIRAVRQGAGELMRPPPGAARITANVPEAEVLIDGDPIEPDPDGVVRGLEPGEHLLVVHAEGYEEVQRSFEVERGATVDLAVSLARQEVQILEAPPWYTRWWVWTLIGVAVAGAGVATAAVLLTPDQTEVSGSLGTVRFPFEGAP